MIFRYLRSREWNRVGGNAWEFNWKISVETLLVAAEMEKRNLVCYVFLYFDQNNPNFL